MNENCNDLSGECYEFINFKTSTGIISSSEHAANSSQHNTVFASWLVATYGQDYLRTASGVFDIAGGAGLLSFELLVRWGIRSTVIDSRPKPNTLKGMLRRRMNKLCRQREEKGNLIERDPLMLFIKDNIKVPPDDKVIQPEVIDCIQGTTQLPFQYIEGSFPNVLLEPKSTCGHNGEGLDTGAQKPLASIYVGMHADQATELIIDVALANSTPFAVVPCCVFKHSFPHRVLKSVFPEKAVCDSNLVSTYEQFVHYLKAKHPQIRSANLPFMGRNTVLYMLPSDFAKK